MNTAEQRLQRAREREAWVRQVTFSHLRQGGYAEKYSQFLQQVSTGHNRAAIYALVGTTRQVEGDGLSRQIRHCLELSVREGFLITEDDLFLEVGSGSNMYRPVLQRLLSLCKNGVYEAIIIESADRWWQGLLIEAGPLFEQLEAAGTRLVTVWGNPPKPLNAVLQEREEREAAVAEEAIGRLLYYAEQSGQAIEALARLWVTEGEPAIRHLVEEQRVRIRQQRGTREGGSE
jgi:DNA invertase Pin-like site-specific DNA recombinase